PHPRPLAPEDGGEGRKRPGGPHRLTAGGGAVHYKNAGQVTEWQTCGPSSSVDDPCSKSPCPFRTCGFESHLGHLDILHVVEWNRTVSHRAATGKDFRRFLLPGAARCGSLLHRFLQRGCTAFCSALEVGVGHLQVVLLGDQGAVADPGA